MDAGSPRFGRHVGGEGTTVGIGWAAEGGDTAVTLSQGHFPGWGAVVAETGVLGYLHTCWCLSPANLVDHVEGRPLTPEVDFDSVEVRGEVLIGAKIDVEAWEGDRVAMGGFELNPQPAKVVDFEPGTRMGIDRGDMVSTWEPAESGDSRSWSPTNVTVSSGGARPVRRCMPTSDHWVGPWRGRGGGTRRRVRRRTPLGSATGPWRTGRVPAPPPGPAGL